MFILQGLKGEPGEPGLKGEQGKDAFVPIDIVKRKWTECNLYVI